MTKRTHLESIILGQIACCDNGYTTIADVLSEANFTCSISGIPSKTIFKAIKSLYPNEPIDLLTVSRKVSVMAPNVAYGDIVYAICDLWGKVHSISNLRHHAFVLIQECIQDEFLNTISRFSGSAVINEIKGDVLKALNLGHDLFDVIVSTRDELKEKGYEKESEVVDSFYKNVVTKTNVIRQKSQIDSVIKSLEMIYEVRPEKRQEIDIHVKSIKKILNGAS